MRFTTLLCSLIPVLLLCGCPTEEPPAEADILWDPPLTSDSGGELDFGDVPVGTTPAPQEFIAGTNNTDEAITFEIDVALDSSHGWLWTSPSDEFDVQPGDDVSFGPRFNPSGNTPSETGGTVAFIWDDHIVTYVIRATVP